jgi:lysophospholipase L1-like esterase
MKCTQFTCLAVFSLAMSLGCSSSDKLQPAGSGGQLAAGGASAPGTSAPSTLQTGGDSSTGGTVGSGGAGQGTGGASTAASGGMVPNSGGSQASGGSKPSGGSAAATTGGAKASGGAPATGGTAAAGGSKPTGGATAATGGTRALGGATSVGGSKPTGGSSSATTGGASSTGGVSNTGGTSGTAGGSTHTGVWRVMPLGDSITGTTCYPQLLSKNLIAGNHKNFTFVGTVTNNQACGSDAPSLNSEGHGGYLVTDLVGTGSHASELQTWVTTDKADMVLMHFGTNDVWGNQRTPTQILSAYTSVVSALRGVNKNVVIFVAQIIPLNPSTCTTCDYAASLNAQIPSWASGLGTVESPIYVVNLHDVFSPASIYAPNSSYTSDGVHPNVTGAQMMADKMYTDLVARGYF